MAKELGLAESFTQDIAALVESFSEKDTVGKQSLSQLFVSDPRTFGASAVSVLAKSTPSAGTRYLVFLLMKGKMLPASLLDPRVADVEEAVAALQAVVETGTKLQPLLELALNKALQEQPGPESRDRVLRILDLLASIVTPNFWNSFQLELMAHADKVVRSKAALLIGRSGKNAAWIGRRFMDHDGRVQASAVEALWSLDAADSRPLLLTASKSKHNRVAANASLGLYRIGEPKAIRLLLDMAGEEGDGRRISALWAMGDTQDPRFLPFLMELFKTSQGKLRLAVTRALGSIRRREKANAEAGALEFQAAQVRAGQDGSRRIGFTLSSQPPRDIGTLTAVAFAIWEGSELIDVYQLKSFPAPPAVAAGFVAPRFISTADEYGNAVTAGLNRCIAFKRPDDPWRLDRHSLEREEGATEVTGEQAFIPYDDAIATQEVKLKHCFIAAGDVLSKIIAADLGRDRATADVLQAMQRQCDGLSKQAGKHHMFVFLHEKSAAQFDEAERLAPLKQQITTDRVTLHGFAPGLPERCIAFRDLCLSTPEGTFTDIAVDQLPQALEQAYTLAVSTAYELTYRLPAGVAAGPVTVKVSSSVGAGQVELTLDPGAASPAAAAISQ
jgi:hypothetical protein